MASAERVELELYSKAVNAAVVRLPSRQFPGMVIQGDSLNMMLGLAEEVFERTRGAADSELSDVAEELRDLLLGRVRHYEAVLKEHQLELPYSRHEGTESVDEDRDTPT